MSNIKSTNEFVIKFANVNGSGSASANQMFAKGVFRSGVPVSPKNIFPSNIQGLPTWFEVRVSEKGYLGRREGVDIVVAMNPQSYNQDLMELNSGGYLLYDSSWKRDFKRTDINVIEIPLTKLCVEEFSNPKQRLLFKNIVYVGALSYLLNMDKEIYEILIKEQFKGKEKLIDPNVKALNLGYDYARENLKEICEIKIETSDKTKGMILTSGNDASGLGCVYGGATVCAWYPITPSTSLAEAFTDYSEKLRVEEETNKNKYAIIQAEDELAAVGMAIGANWNGARGFTATSGPGISLMSEFIGLAYFAEVPLVLFDIQRGGPSTGMPTRTQQSDVLSCAYASHGDTKHVLLIPSDPKECFEFAAEAFDLADRIQTPVIVLSDLDLGMNDWTCPEFKWDDTKLFDKGKVLHGKDLEEIENFGRYLDVDGDGIPYRTYPGAHPEKGAYFTRGTSHDEYAKYTEDGVVNARNLSRLLKKYQTASELVPNPIFKQETNTSSIGVIYYGSTEASMQEALDLLHEEGVILDAMRLRAFPFNLEVWEFIEDHDLLFIVEQNRDGQMRTLIMAEGGIIPDKLVSVLCFDGQPITADFISNKISSHLTGSPSKTAVGGK
ncbi:MAG: ferredoxin oxidoreductase [Gammaproteobacteria bacterium]|nr:2-oxoacid:acceptor oxidoreductase subunit alpha [SAR86 cluster bacterium]GIS75406.1 MAG: ferredoxin oxidoreductase [Gammaproteobacteria bacterium]GIT61264.1 MAG: ferredoxin oxidoreductase [Gammaproteobacteria bacterium]|tara:strand:+ start:630 stop:2459 length:1830 start_codon:yes stop_codon:yes gene_type:complete